jgi:hypothetical protein
VTSDEFETSWSVPEASGPAIRGEVAAGPSRAPGRRVPREGPNARGDPAAEASEEKGLAALTAGFDLPIAPRDRDIEAELRRLDVASRITVAVHLSVILRERRVRQRCTLWAHAAAKVAMPCATGGQE